MRPGLPIAAIILSCLLQAPASAGKYDAQADGPRWSEQHLNGQVDEHGDKVLQDDDHGHGHHAPQASAKSTHHDAVHDGGIAKMSARDLAEDLGDQLRAREAARRAMIAARRADAIAEWEETLGARTHGGHPDAIPGAKPDPIDQSRFGARPH